MSDNGAWDLAERLRNDGRMFDGPDMAMSHAERGRYAEALAAAILANGAVFLPDGLEITTGMYDEVHRALREQAAELARLRTALAEIAEGTEPDRIGQYGPLRDWVHRRARAALDVEGSAGT